MPDKEYKIRISTAADPTGLRDTSQGFKDLQESGTQAHQEIGKEAEQLEIKHKDLKSAVKGLHAEFPELSHIARLALNPIAFDVAAITSAFALFNWRVQTLMQTMAGFELPQVTPTQVGHVNAA